MIGAVAVESFPGETGDRKNCGSGHRLPSWRLDRLPQGFVQFGAFIEAAETVAGLLDHPMADAGQTVRRNAVPGRPGDFDVKPASMRVRPL